VTRKTCLVGAQPAVRVVAGVPVPQPVVDDARPNGPVTVFPPLYLIHVSAEPYAVPVPVACPSPAMQRSGVVRADDGTDLTATCSEVRSHGAAIVPELQS
jgi:hypothetical protein